MEVAATTPSTPDNAHSPPIIRRAFTVPTRLSSAARSPTEAGAQGAETLFAHPRCRIVSFNSGLKRPSSAGRDQHESAEPVGTLPWASTTERTIAAGPLRIYRVLEVSFLSSGNTLRPILAKSQCWCVDGESKFVLKIGYDSYYRIELPNTCAEENDKVDELKGVFAKVLQFEVTPCPFKRGFTVELPERSTEPVKKRPWRPRQQSQLNSEREFELGPEDAWHKSGISSRAVAEVDTIEPAALPDTDSVLKDSVTIKANSQEDGEACKPINGEDQGTEIMAAQTIDCEPDRLDLFKTPTRPKSLKASRAITAPAQLTLRTTPPSNSSSNAATRHNTRIQSSSGSSSMESFHSFHSPISPLPPSPPYSTPSSPTLSACDDDTIQVPRVRSQKGDTLDPTLTRDSPKQWIMSPTLLESEAQAESSLPLPQTPTLISDTASQGEDSWSEAITPSPQTQLRHRRSSRQRAPSPLPAPANIYSPTARLSGHHLTTAILQKTCSLLLGPPVQLVALMLNIARKIAKGSYCGFSFGTGESGQRIPCSWDFSDTEDDQIWDEDDYGVSLGNISSSKNLKAKEVGGSWEID
ncbi:MAG: hypothetical protein Q9195_003783 [Heterodermia aff. obscurata]